MHIGETDNADRATGLRENPAGPSSKVLDPSPWPHRLAWPSACSTFPLIWMGGLVTTYGAGMAVPEWPNTYGIRPFSCIPRQAGSEFGTSSWEHSHRLVGASVGMIAIALACTLWFQDRRRWMRQLGLSSWQELFSKASWAGLARGGRCIVPGQTVQTRTAPLFFALRRNGRLHIARLDRKPDVTAYAHAARACGPWGRKAGVPL